MPAIFLHPDGLVILVRAQPGACKNSINSLLKGALKISVQPPPEDGKANLAIAELLCKVLKLKKKQVKLIQGETSRDKKFLIKEVALENLVEKIKSLGLKKVV